MSSGIQVGWGSQWETLANAINDYYGGGVSSAQYQQVVQMLNSGDYTMQEMESIIGNIPEFNRTYNAAGQLTGVSYNATAAGNTAAGSAANAINSNAASATQTQFKTVQTVTKNSQTGKVQISDNLTKYNSGSATPTTIKGVAGSAVSAICAASVGIALGKTIDSALYNANPSFWDDNNMSTLNPETWGSITAGENSLNASLFNMILGIDNTTQNPQPYIDETAFAYMAAYMAANNVFAPINESVIDTPTGVTLPTGASLPFSIIEMQPNTEYVFGPSVGTKYGLQVRNNTDPVYGVLFRKNYNANNDSVVIYTCSKSAFQDSTYFAGQTPSFSNATSTSSGGRSWYRGNGISGYYTIPIVSDFPINEATANPRDWGWSGIYGIQPAILFGTIQGGGGVDGITPQEGATQFNPAGIDPTDIAAILAALKLQFPELWENRVEVSPDGETTITYIPVGFPTGGTGGQPTTSGATADELAPDITGDGQNSTEELIKTLIDLIQNPQDQSGMESDTTTPTEPIDPNMPNGGSGITPPFVIPIGSASALYSVYNPSQSQLNSLGAWLWSSNFVDQLLKLFNDPMQAIIGLHKVFATPPTSGTGTIKVGYLDSGVGSNLVSAQYTEIDCGTIKLDEYFKNALDYVKTDVYLYLPFVGIVSLNVEDVTRANINVKYKVDVLTGACLASVNVTRDAGGGGQLYAYAGNCAVQYPLSSGSYMGIVSGILGIAGSVAGTMLSGGAMLPMALGVGASALNSMKTRVEHSGSLSGNSGAMGIKKPYLIIRRPQTKIAENYPLLAGGSDNTYGVLSSFTGHVRVKYVHIENIPATSDELNEIETLLKSGVMI